MNTYKLNEIVSSSGKSIVYHRTVKSLEVKRIDAELSLAGLSIDSLTEDDVKKILAKSLPISYTQCYALDKVGDVIGGIDVSGINANPGMYGPPAIYNTYELSSQFSGKMYHYGCTIVKSFLKLNHVLILDARYAEKIYGTLARPSEQLKYFKSTSLGPKEMLLADQAYAASLKDPNYLTSEFADPLTNSKPFKKEVEKGTIKGIVFTGSNDGQVLVAYDQDILVPISWCFADNTKQVSQWFKFSSTGGRNLRKIAAGKMKYAYDFNDSVFARAKWFLAVLKANDVDSIIKALDERYVYPLMQVDKDFLVFKFVDVRNLDLINKLFEISFEVKAPIVNIKSKISKGSLLLEAVRKNNYVLANYLVDNYKIVDVNAIDRFGTKLIDVLRTKASISDPEEIRFWNNVAKKPHYIDRDNVVSLLTGMGLIQESYSNSLKLYKSIY